MSTAPETNYYAEVEGHFVAARGSPLFITPREWQLVAAWEQAGIPLEVVIAAIDRVFERPKTRQRRRTLAYCRQSVEAEFRRYKEARLGAREGEHEHGAGGATDEPSPQGELVRLVAELERASSTAGLPALVDALRATAREVEALASSAPERAGSIEARLSALDAALVGALERGLGEEERAALEREAERTLASYRQRMPEAVYTTAVRSAFLRRLRARFGLSRLSLF